MNLAKLSGIKGQYTKLIAFLYTGDEQLEIQILKTAPIKTESKSIKDLGINLIKDV